MPHPTFLILGASKAGSTSLYSYLAQHADISVSEPKEPRFFPAEYHRGLDYYWRSYFKSYRGQKQIGEACTKNLSLPFVAGRVAAALPEARLFILCRNPVERTISAYWHSYSHGSEPLPFEAAIEKNLRRLETGPRFEDEAEAAVYARMATAGDRALQRAFGFYIEPGHYARHIARYRALFGADRIRIIFFEELARDAPAVVADAHRFLGLEPRPLAAARAQNSAMSRPAARLCSAVANLPGVNRIPTTWRAEVRRRIGECFRGGARPEIGAAARRLLVEHFRPHNDRLAELTGRNLDHWNEPGLPPQPRLH